MRPAVGVKGFYAMSLIEVATQAARHPEGRKVSR